MNLIKIGPRIINLDMVTEVNLAFVGSDDRKGVRVYFGTESATFYDTGAAALRSWLMDIATDVIEVQEANKQ